MDLNNLQENFLRKIRGLLGWNPETYYSRDTRKTHFCYVNCSARDGSSCDHGSISDTVSKPYSVNSKRNASKNITIAKLLTIYRYKASVFDIEWRMRELISDAAAPNDCCCCCCAERREKINLVVLSIVSTLTSRRLPLFGSRDTNMAGQHHIPTDQRWPLAYIICCCCSSDSLIRRVNAEIGK